MSELERVGECSKAVIGSERLSESLPEALREPSEERENEARPESDVLDVRLVSPTTADDDARPDGGTVELNLLTCSGSVELFRRGSDERMAFDMNGFVK
jgi:hypothetical protein